jgi:hypothetical protein
MPGAGRFIGEPVMNTDRYTRTVLTIIAACLLWLCARTAGFPVSAQQRTPPLSGERAQPVVIVGWGTLDSEGRISLTTNGARDNPTTDPNVPVKVVGYPMPARPLDVRLPYTDEQPLAVGISRIKPAGEWEPVRTRVEAEPVRPRPGRD